jgi:tRNA-dihydrouridine synthase C
MDKYFTPFIVPHKDKKFSTREMKELSPEHNQGLHVVPQLLTNNVEDFMKTSKDIRNMGYDEINLNFGCPSKFVHRSNGGAALLKTPKLMGEVIKQVRDALPSEIPLSAKIRLGWDNENEADEIFEECVNAGASRIVIHARTKKDGYLPNTVKWETIAKLKANSSFKDVVANGDIIDKESAQSCQKISQCNDLMVGRFAIATPNLERVIRTEDEKLSVNEIGELLLKYIGSLKGNINEHYLKARTKQFFGYIRLSYKELADVFKMICQAQTILEIENILDRLANGDL